MDEEECPVCLEPLLGTTIVENGCCHKKVHIQCYVSKCPMCRAELPKAHVEVPIPVHVHIRRPQNTVASVVFLATFIGVSVFIWLRE
jgi:hypothetical protein